MNTLSLDENGYKGRSFSFSSSAVSQSSNSLQSSSAMNQTNPSRGQRRSSKCACTYKISNHSRIPTTGKESTKPSISDTAPRFYCAFPGCTSSFRRASDQVRHEKSIHGPKRQCIYQGCKYSTGRSDKLNEHTRKIHKGTGKSVVV
jgi:hypothetical protein